ncbi:hypothetical protein CX676_07740 [Paracoccus zhejiangensis]|uniref:Uncharacterized protein n=1 Tax=Paracoccus zhejiangensis TaxID=1077935 RepID=A0A2H5EXR9_9RHOB|nr:hypothetical protein CX676_07740 [Paracoccus zhejiangensis]
MGATSLQHRGLARGYLSDEVSVRTVSLIASVKADLSCRVWNRIPDGVRGQIIELALDEHELSPRELASFTDESVRSFMYR